MGTTIPDITQYSEYYIELVYMCNIDPKDTLSRDIRCGEDYVQACKYFDNMIEGREEYLDPGTYPAAFTSSESFEHWYIAEYILVGIFLKGIRMDEDDPNTVRDILKYSHIHMW